MSKKSFNQPRKTVTQKEKAAPQKHNASHPLSRLWTSRLSVPVIFFLLVWLWAGWYYGSVFQISREYSLWVADPRIMNFILCQPYGILRYVGRAMLQLYKFPWLGGLLVAAMLVLTSWLMGYCFKRSRSNFLMYLPALAYIAVITWHGLDIFFEARTGFILGIPLVVFVVLCIWAAIIKSFRSKRKKITVQGEGLSDDSAVAAAGTLPQSSGKKNRRLSVVNYQLLSIVLCLAAIVGFDQWQRPYVRVICQLLEMEYRQDWAGIQKLARANAKMSNRPMACSYGISLVQTGQVAERLFDIRMDYDSLHVHGLDWKHNNASVLYVPEGNYYGGFIESAMHSCMEQMVMTGPTIRLLKLQTKCALMRCEWDLAERYLTMLRRVPFEGAFVEKYEPMVRRPDLVNADKEMALIRLTEPLHDSYESQYQQPLFMGYNLMLVEGRSKEALINSLVVCLYTKLMPQFVERLEPIVGTTPPSIIIDGILLAENKNPGLSQHFTGMQFRQAQLQSFLSQTRPLMQDRPGHAYELFPKYKGYYPYYYFFGNLKATKKGYTSLSSSNSGVN